MKKSLDDISGIAADPCPVCGVSDVQEHAKVIRFRYGEGATLVELSAMVPTLRCSVCGLEFTDERAEAAQQDAVCRHLGLLTPREIRGIRDQLGLTRAALAELAGVGEASIKRWEGGLVTQNKSIDRLLRLLADGNNVARCREYNEMTSSTDDKVAVRSVFRTNLSRDCVERSKLFSLRLDTTVSECTR